MFKTKPVQNDAAAYEVPGTAPVADVAQWNLQSMPTEAGALVPYGRSASPPVPQGPVVSRSLPVVRSFVPQQPGGSPMQVAKPVQIDGKAYEMPTAAPVADVAHWNQPSMAPQGGATFARQQFARMPVPEGFDANLTQINKGDGVDLRPAPIAMVKLRLHAACSAMVRFAESGGLWHWTAVIGKLTGLFVLMAVAVGLVAAAGNLLLANDRNLQSLRNLDPDNSGLADLRALMLGVVVVGTVAIVVLAGRMARLWQQTFALVPFVQRALARTTYTLRLFGTILVASVGGVVVSGAFPEILKGNWDAAPACLLGLVFLAAAIHSLVTWIRQLNQVG
jgi:hypothetical protein